MPTKFDAILIGTGQAAPALAGRLSKAGMTVAVVERKFFGGTCVNTGCIPTKTLVASAAAAQAVRRAAEYGVRAPGSPAVDMKAVKARKDRIAGASRWIEGHPEWMAADGIHPNDDGYAEIARRMDAELDRLGL